MLRVVKSLKEEIRRLARKEARAEFSGTKRAAAQHRREIAALKRQVAACRRQLDRIEAMLARDPAGGERREVAEPQNRFSSRSVRAQRRRLRFSAADYGRLIGVSAQTVYQWEQGKSRPRRSQFAQLIALRSIGRREALARLAHATDRA
jgi:DNA-binding transcriptional regulator YiaG